MSMWGGWHMGKAGCHHTRSVHLEARVQLLE